MDYLRLKASIAELEKDAAEWRRKVEVAQLISSCCRSSSGSSGGPLKPGNLGSG